MVNDQEPRYRLVDSNGNVVGSLFQNGDGNVEIQDETGTGSVFGPNGIVTPAIDAESVSAEEIDIETPTILHSSDGFETIDGADIDERLDNALDVASAGDDIYLGPEILEDNRTGADSIDIPVTIIGTNSGDSSGTRLQADWEITTPGVDIRHIRIDGDNRIDINGNFCTIEDIRLSSTDTELRVVDGVENNFARISDDGSVIFEDGTSRNIVDSSTGIDVTDNDGGNTVGDIA